MAVADYGLRNAADGLPEDPVQLQRYAREHSTEIRCPACGKAWHRYGKILPVAFDARCPECSDKKIPAQEVPRHVYLQKAGVPALFRRLHFIEPPRWPQDEREIFKGFDTAEWKGAPWCVGFMGVTRTGKTSMAVELLWRNHKRPGEAFFIRADRLVSVLLGADGQERKEQAYRRAHEAPIAIIDDLGWGALGRGLELVNEVIADRHGAQLPTLWTANHEYRELTAKLPPMMSRLETGLIIRLSPKDAWGINGEPPQGFRQ